MYAFYSNVAALEIEKIPGIPGVSWRFALLSAEG
jgi:hypothetical protein